MKGECCGRQGVGMLSAGRAVLDIGGRLGYNEICVNAAMAELADAMDLGSIGRPCRFESC